MSAAPWYRATLLALLLSGGRVEAQVDPSGQWRTLHTPHFLVHFRPADREPAQRTAREAERAWGLLAAELRPPRGMVDVTLSDDIDVSNGFTTVFPSSRITVLAAPLPELTDFDDWLRLVTTHELTHVFHLDRTKGWWRGLQSVFGRVPGLFPNEYQPSWVIEGLAVYYESRFTGGGRVHGGGRCPARTGPRPRRFRADARRGPVDRARAPRLARRCPRRLHARRRQEPGRAADRGRPRLAGAASPPCERPRPLRLARGHPRGHPARLHGPLAHPQRPLRVAAGRPLAPRHACRPRHQAPGRRRDARGHRARRGAPPTLARRS